MQRLVFNIFSFAVMIVLFVLLSSLSLAGELDTCKKDPTWYQCSVDTDCAIISNPCGWPIDSINKSYAKEAEQCNIMEGANYGCVMYDKNRDGRFKSLCVEHKCVAQKQE